MKRKSWAGKIAKLAAANSCVRVVTTWYGLVWYGIVKLPTVLANSCMRAAEYGVKWNGMVWLVEFGIVWCGVKGMVWNDMIRVVLCRMILYEY